MSAGTVVITGGILAGVILLCIVAVLCYCRLQYYCCKKDESEVDVASVGTEAPHSHSHTDCKACSALAMDGTTITPISLDRLERLEAAAPPYNHCPNCSPFSLRPGPAGDVRNGGERLGFHTYRESPPPPLPLCANPRGLSPLSYYSSTDMFPPPPRPYSTQV